MLMSRLDFCFDEGQWTLVLLEGLGVLDAEWEGEKNMGP